jgi:hypothetical protein
LADGFFVAGFFAVGFFVVGRFFVGAFFVVFRVGATLFFTGAFAGRTTGVGVCPSP